MKVASALCSLNFSLAGYTVRTAEDGREAMQLCRSELFDAVLSDVVMPQLGGHDLARWLATYYPATKFILMTGWDTGCEDCPIAGRCSILAKPFAPTMPWQESMLSWRTTCGKHKELVRGAH
jgi:DNA-binding NtrC family response regulator